MAALVVVVDTEEEFDWSKGFSRSNTSVLAMRSIERIQHVFDEYEVRPVYVVDYPIVTQIEGARPLQEILSSGRCVIGAHVHPWVNPPFEEGVTRHNSFPGNLPRSLETEKLKVLSECIGDRFGVQPTIYKAGRYGVGPNTWEILEEMGYEVDLSTCPYMDYSAEGGPDFTKNSPWPFWFGKERQLLGLPLTVGFSGFLKRYGTRLHRAACARLLRELHLPGVLARVGVLDKIWLSPEGYTTAEHQKLVGSLYSEGLRVFSMAFHSPSLEPGNTPYVRTQGQLEQFITTCRRFFDFFFDELGGYPTTPLELKKSLETNRQSQVHN